jgi:hypothetical protein
VREQSHIDAMRAAIRGDLERARARRPSIFERPAAPPVAEDPEPTPEPMPVITTAAPRSAPAPPTEPPPAARTPPAPAQRVRDRLAFWRR